MLGLGDGWVLAAFIVIIASTLLCVIYGILNWNKGSNESDPESKEWLKEEIEIEKSL